MGTKQELEEEVKTLKGLRRTHIKDIVIGGGLPFIYAPSAIESVKTNPLEMTIIAVIGTLASFVFFGRSVSAYDRIDRSIREHYKKIKGLNNPLLTRPKLY